MSEAGKRHLPLFPLSAIVLPGGRMPLRLFERRYLDMVSACFRHDKGFGICLIAEGREAGVPARAYPIGTEVRLVDFDQGKDGLLHVVTEGVQEFDVLSQTLDEAGLLHGVVRDFPPIQPLQQDATFAALADKLESILNWVDTDIPLETARFDDPDWVVYRLLELLPLAPEMRYEMLQLRHNADRLQALSTLQIEISPVSGSG